MTLDGCAGRVPVDMVVPRKAVSTAPDAAEPYRKYRRRRPRFRLQPLILVGLAKRYGSIEPYGAGRKMSAGTRISLQSFTPGSMANSRRPRPTFSVAAVVFHSFI